MKDIFENAKFGDKFKTEDNTMVLYIRFEQGYHIIAFEEDCYKYDNDGTLYGMKNQPKGYRIVSRWEEPIDTDALNNDAEEYERSVKALDDILQSQLKPSLAMAYKAGYKQGIMNKL